VKLLVKLANVCMSHYVDEHNSQPSIYCDRHSHYMRWNASGINHQVLDSPKARWSLSQGDKEVTLLGSLQIVLVDVVLSAPPIRDVRVSI